MFDAILDFLETGITGVFDLITKIFDGGVDMFYDSVGLALTTLGELLLLGALVGLAIWGINFIRSMIPFLR